MLVDCNAFRSTSRVRCTELDWNVLPSIWHENIFSSCDSRTLWKSLLQVLGGKSIHVVASIGTRCFRRTKRDINIQSRALATGREFTNDVKKAVFRFNSNENGQSNFCVVFLERWKLISTSRIEVDFEQVKWRINSCKRSDPNVSLICAILQSY